MQPPTKAPPVVKRCRPPPTRTSFQSQATTLTSDTKIRMGQLLSKPAVEQLKPEGSSARRAYSPRMPSITEESGSSESERESGGSWSRFTKFAPKSSENQRTQLRKMPTFVSLPTALEKAAMKDITEISLEELQTPKMSSITPDGEGIQTTTLS